MSTVTAPPHPPGTPDSEALFEEARRHRRHRRLKLAASAAALIAAGAGAFAVLGAGASHPASVLVLKDGALTSVPTQTVVLLVDVSGSMRATDLKPTRLGATLASMKAFLGRLPKRFEVGLVEFSSTAKVLQPPTLDRARVLDALSSLSPEAATALGDGLEAAVTLTVASLEREGIRRAPGHDLPAVVILQSDGAQNRGALSPMEAARRAMEAGIRVDGVALGTPEGVVKFGSGIYSSSVPVPPDPTTVAQIASVTGGVEFKAPTAARLQAIYNGLAASIAR